MAWALSTPWGKSLAEFDNKKKKSGMREKKYYSFMPPIVHMYLQSYSTNLQTVFIPTWQLQAIQNQSHKSLHHLHTLL